MTGDVRNPFGDMKGYQFWALLGVLTIAGTRVLLAFDIPLGIFTISLWSGPEVDILTTDAVGFLMVLNARFTYKGFLDQST